jgi:diguanylate cyclase (GGDEF)-like protein
MMSSAFGSSLCFRGRHFVFEGTVTEGMVDIIALTLIAALLAAVMLIAWRSFGRPQPALVWAIAFLIATAEWAISLIMALYAQDNGLLYGLIAGLGCLSNALIAIGFVQRARAQASMVPLLLAAAAAALLIALLSVVIPHRGFRDAIWLFFGGLMLVISAANVARSLKAATLPERAVALMLVLFAGIYFGTAAVALGEGASGHGQGLVLFRAVLALIYPVAFIGVGIFSVFVLAADLAENMRMLATSDELTGIHNRRGFEDAAERAIRNAQRQRQPLAIVIADIDNFKTINDRHGHSAGDRALRHFASRLERLARRGDLIGRIGGEEFALMLVNTRARDALDVVERIRRDIAAMPVDGAAKIRMTASFGVTGLRPGDTSLAALLSRADRALYRSKLEGRDRVTSA